MGDDTVLIVGAGPTGLTAACALLSAGVPCRIVDAAASPTTASRAIGLSARSLEILHYVGAASALTEHGVPCPGADFYAGGKRIGHIDLGSRTDTRFGYMLAIPQSEIELLLAERLAELGGKIERPVELAELVVDDDTCAATLVDHRTGDEERVRPTWVIGADGSHSKVRAQAGIRRATVEESQAYLIVDVLGESTVPPEAGSYYFHPDGMALIAPLPDGSHRLAATVRDPRHETTLDVVRGVFAERTADAINVTGLRDAGWGAQSVQVRTGIADRMRHGRCFIAGDAVHSYGPLGGQGMNGGIQDAYALAWRLAMVIRGRAEPGLLDGYETDRLYAAKLARQATDSQTRLATLRPVPLRMLRDLAVRLGTATGIFDRVFVPPVTQLGIRYRASGRVPRPGAHSGSRLPDAPALLASGETAWIHDLIDDRAPTVLLIDDTTGTDPSVLRSAVGPVPHLLCVHRDGPAASSDGESVTDRGGALRRHLRVAGSTALLVRPDRYVVASRPVKRVGELHAFVTDMIGQPDAAVTASEA